MVVLLFAARQGKKYDGVVVWLFYCVPPARAKNMWGYGMLVVWLWLPPTKGPVTKLFSRGGVSGKFSFAREEIIFSRLY